MSDSIQRLILELKAKVSVYNKDVLKSTKATSRFQESALKDFNKIEKGAKKTGTSLFAFSKVAKGVFSALAIRGFTRFTDDMITAENQLRNVTASLEQFNFTQSELNRIADDTRQDVNGLTSVFAKFSRAGQEAGFTIQETLDFTERLTKSFKLEGNTVKEVNSTLLQLVQSFRKGRIDGEEFRSLSENSTIALQALAKQLKTNVGNLKDLAKQGKITARDLVDALSNIEPEIEAEFSKLTPTFSDIGKQLGNVLTVGFKRSGALDVLKNFQKSLSEGLSAITFGLSDQGVLLTTQLKLLDKIGAEAVISISSMSKEIAKLRNEILKSASEEEIKDAQEAIDVLKQKITETSGEAGFFDKQFFQVDSLIKRFALLSVKAEEAKIRILEQPSPKVKDKPLVSLSRGEKSALEKAQRRLQGVKEISETELQLLTALENNKITLAEEKAIVANQKELDRLEFRFDSIIARLGVHHKTIEEIEAKRQDKGLMSLTEDEKNILLLKENFMTAELALTEKQNKALLEIRERGAKKIDSFSSEFKTLQTRAEMEIKLLEEVEAKKVSLKEASALVANEKEIKSINDLFERKLEVLNVNRARLQEIEILADAVGLENLTLNEQKLLELKASFMEAELSLTRKQAKELRRILDIEAKHKQASALQAGSRLFSAISSLAKKGSAIQKVAAKASIIANTAAGVMRQYKDLPFFQAVVTKGAILLEGAAALKSIGEGGGAEDTGGGSGAPPGGGNSSAQEETPSANQEVSISVLGEEGNRGTGITQISFNSDSGGAFENALAEILNEMIRKGRVDFSSGGSNP